MIEAIRAVVVCGLALVVSFGAHAQEKFLTGPAALDAIRGSWGGNMHNADMGGGVVLEEIYLEVSSIPWQAKTHMKMRIVKSNLQVLVDVDQRNGKVSDGEVRFAKVQWARWVPKTGQKDKIEGNSLVLRMLEDKRLYFQFEGADGFTARLMPRTRSAPATR